MKKIMYIATLLCVLGCNFNEKETMQLTPSNNINVMWQNLSAWDSTTASKIVQYNPDKFIINVDGPGSNDTNPTCGPHIKDLIPFIDTLVNVFGYKGILAMHPDLDSAEYRHDWMGKGNLPSISPLSADVYQVYVDYFKEINDSLKSAGLPQFTELLLETETSYVSSSKDKFQKPLFDKVRTYMNDSSIKLSATSDWEGIHYRNWGVDYYYLQMYDMSWVDTCRESCNAPNGLGTHLADSNKYSTARITELVKDMEIALNHWKFPITDSVCITFTYAIGKKPHVDAPMFGEDSSYWTKVQFEQFITEFRKIEPTVDIGIWDCASPLKRWKY
jgi:hypothetical protein